MMKNKVKFKKYSIITLIVSICLVIVYISLNMYEYSSYTRNFNNNLGAIITLVKTKYPDISENEIMEILNNKTIDEDMFERYGIYIDEDTIILENEELHNKFLIINTVFLVLSFLILVIIFIVYSRRKGKEISEITKYIEEINRKNYSLHIDEISEDELSILKNEIYKTTVMLKESANNSIKDKKELKKSLEDISHQLKTPLTSILVILDIKV